MDGNRLREPLTRIFHTLSLGELAVDCFFLLSGYLITQSMIRSGSLLEFLKRRVLRIYPGFAVAFLASTYVLGPLVGAHPLSRGVRTLLRIPLLLEPSRFPHQLAGLPFPFLNGAMWTIKFEFCCYLMVGMLGALGILRRRWAVFLLTAVAATLFVAYQFGFGATFPIYGSSMRFGTVFLVGSNFYLFRDRIFSRLRGRTAAVSAFVAALALYRDPYFADVGLALFGGAALFWLAFKASLGPIQKINDRWDISYGVYLYGWPVTSLLLWEQRGISPWKLAPEAILFSFAMGAISWWGVEKWFKSPTKPSLKNIQPSLVSEESTVSA